MANPQAENGHIKIAHEIVTAFKKTNLTAYQYHVLWVILSKTYGWNKRQDRISISQFEQETGIKRRHTVRTIKELEAMNMITAHRESTKTAIYSFQKDYDKWLLPHKVIVNKNQLLPNEGQTITLLGNKTITSLGNYKSNKAIIKSNIVKKLSDKESLSAYLLTLPEYQNLSYQLKELILTFINKIRMANKTKSMAQSKAVKVLSSLNEIMSKYGQDNLKAGIEAVFLKEQKDGFLYSSHNVTGYIRAVAKAEYLKAMRKANEERTARQREQIKQAEAGQLFNEIKAAIGEKVLPGI